MQSMTGYVQLIVPVDKYTLHFVLQSVNSRVLHLQFDVPDFCEFCVPVWRKLVMAHVRRGALRVKVSCDSPPRKSPLNINWNSVCALYESYAAIRTRLKLTQDVRLSDLLCAADFFHENPWDLSPYAQKLEDSFLEALVLLGDARSDEGKSIHELIAKILQQLSVHVQEIRETAESVLEKNVTRLEKRCTDMLHESFDAQRLLTEITLLTARLDFQEELERFSMHLEKLRGLCGNVTPLGKKLEFIVQEMLREVNTLSMKANDFYVSSVVVEMKCLLEQLREQCANIE